MVDPPTPQLDLNEEPQWDWILRDAVVKVNILDGERTPLPPSMQVQTHYQNRVATLHSEPTDNLRGRFPVEVADKASKIKLGSTFNSFVNFDHCLDSSCVMNGRSSHKMAPKRAFQVRDYHYGPIV